MSLSYETMLEGVPGTGTRRGGLAGSMLTIGIDGILVLRFHVLCTRIAGMATLLFMMILLPIFYTTCNVVDGDHLNPTATMTSLCASLTPPNCTAS